HQLLFLATPSFALEIRSLGIEGCWGTPLTIIGDSVQTKQKGRKGSMALRPYSPSQSRMFVSVTPGNFFSVSLWSMARCCRPAEQCLPPDLCRRLPPGWDGRPAASKVLSLARLGSSAPADHRRENLIIRKLCLQDAWGLGLRLVG